MLKVQFDRRELRLHRCMRPVLTVITARRPSFTRMQFETAFRPRMEDDVYRKAVGIAEQRVNHDRRIAMCQRSTGSVTRVGPRVTRLLFAACLACGLLGGGSFADDKPVQAATEEEARLLLRAALSARLSVRTGRVKLTGHYTVRSLRGYPSWDGPVSGFYCFDRETNQFRYDGDLPCAAHINVPGDTSIVPPDRPATVHRAQFGFCRAKDYFANWSQIGSRTVNGVNLFPLSQETEARKLGCGQRPLDVMAFGMLVYVGLEKGTETGKAYDLMLSRPVRSIIADEKNTTIVMGRDDIVCRVVLDRKLAAPVRLEHGPASYPDRFQSDVAWRMVSGVAVPVKYSASFTMPEIVVETFECDLEWLSVNEDIPGEEFEYTAFNGIPPNLHDVFDMRASPPAYIGRWVGDGVVKPPQAARTPALEELRPNPETSGLWKTLVVANSLFVILLIAVWMVRRKARTKSSV